MRETKFLKKFILVDLDGLLVDTEKLKYQIYKKILKQQNKFISLDEYKKLIGFSREKICSYLYQKKKLNINPVDLANKKKNEYLIEINNSGIKPIVNNTKIVYELSKFFPIILVTSQNKNIAEIVLKKMNIKKYFKHVITGEISKNKKPAPDIFLSTMKKIGATPKGCIVLEDSESGILAGKKAEIFCIAIPNKFTKTQSFAKADKVFYKASPKTVVNYIKNL